MEKVETIQEAFQHAVELGPGKHTIPCAQCEENKKETKSIGIAKFAKALVYGEATKQIIEQRTAICKACTATDQKGERLYRTEKRKDGQIISWCGVPSAIAVPPIAKRMPTMREARMLRRDPIKDGCGCYLDYKVTRAESSCPLGYWAEASKEETKKIVDQNGEGPVHLENAHLIQMYDRVFQNFWPNICALKAWRDAWPDVKLVVATYDFMIPWLSLFSIADEIINVRTDRRSVTVDLQWEFGRPQPGKRVQDSALLNAGDDEHVLVPTIPEMNLSKDVLDWVSDTQGFERDETILLAPIQSDSKYRWPLHRWIMLEERLLDAGYGVVVFDPEESGADTQSFRSIRYLGMDAEKTAALHAKADLVIAGNINSAHLRGMLKLPAIYIAGPESGPDHFSFYEGAVQILKSQLPCSPCYYRPERGYVRACDFACDALYRITVDPLLEMVRETLDKMEKNHA